MKPNLVEELLVRSMEWTEEEVAIERPFLQAMASFKLDEYQQFGPGMRYTESLVNWLEQFDTLAEKQLAYAFVKSKLVFISTSQLFQLLTICYSTQIQPRLLRKTAMQLRVEPYQLSVIGLSREYLLNSARSVYIGLSDGARMDYFRRVSRVNNEQILLTYTVESEKTQEMVANLTKDHHVPHFESIFLLDDFTASGQTTIRQKAGEYTGKVVKTLESLHSTSRSLYHLVQGQPFELHLIFYLATSDALAYIDTSLQQLKQAQGYTFTHTVQAIQELPKSFSLTETSAPELAALCAKYYDETLTTSHLKVGGTQGIHLGYHNGGLPLVLSHNTPNNSLPLLWSPDDKQFRGLFPRVSRHS
jgi:hypothetical protein